MQRKLLMRRARQKCFEEAALREAELLQELDRESAAEVEKDIERQRLLELERAKTRELRQNLEMEKERQARESFSMNWNRLKQKYDHHDVTFPLNLQQVILLCHLWELLNYSEVLFMDR